MEDRQIKKEKRLKLAKHDHIHTTKSGVKILVTPGEKKESEFDFRVRYKEPSKRKRTPKHIHLIIDLYMKKERNEELTMRLVDHIIDIIKIIKPTKAYPPKLQTFPQKHVQKFADLDKFGEYSVEFLLVVAELIMIQEKTNYPNGTMNLELFQKFRKEADIFSVVSAATFTRGK